MTTPVGKMTITFLLVFCTDFVGKMTASQKDHKTDCYFCITDISVLSAKNKKT